MNKLAKLWIRTALVLVLATVGFNAQAQDPFIGEIRFFGGNFAPRGWAQCDGQLLSISQYTALFSILGTTYGGDGRTTFGLPDMRGRSPVHQGTGPGLVTVRLGQRGGRENVVLTTNNLPAHSHPATVSVSTGPADTLDGGYLANPSLPLAQAPVSKGYATAPPIEDRVNLAGVSVGNNATTGAGFDVRSPYVVVNCIIALHGTFPSRN